MRENGCGNSVRIVECGCPGPKTLAQRLDHVQSVAIKYLHTAEEFDRAQFLLEKLLQALQNGQHLVAVTIACLYLLPYFMTFEDNKPHTTPCRGKGRTVHR